MKHSFYEYCLCNTEITVQHVIYRSKVSMNDYLMGSSLASAVLYYLMGSSLASAVLYYLMGSSLASAMLYFCKGGVQRKFN